MPIKRSDVKLGERYANAIAVINRNKEELARLKAEKDLLLETMTQETQSSQVAIRPKYWHAEAALEWVSQGTAKEPRTVARAVQLLNNGEFHGKYFDIKVKIDASYISKVKSKLKTND
jgi:hypothetical protein